MIRVRLRSALPPAALGSVRWPWRALCWLVASFLLLAPGPAQGWIETEVRSHRATVSVESDGSAEVRHELVLRVRGGPLMSLEIDGVGTAVELLGDGTVRPAVQGSPTVWPLEAALGSEGAIQLRVGAERGLRAGVYRFEFGYHLDLHERGWLERRGRLARVTWVQPRFSGGIDSARVVFRLPRFEGEPELPSDDSASAGVLLSEVRRGPDRDEVELVRAHVARGEPAVWQLNVPLALFPKLAAQRDIVRPEPGATPLPSPRLLELPRTAGWIWGFGAALGLLYAVVLIFKARAVARNCARAGVTPRPLLPLPGWLRIVTAAGFVGSAGCLALLERPAEAGVCWASALLLAAFLPPRRQVKARGPGEWVRLSPEELATPATPPAAGRWLDAGSARGALVLGGVALGTAGAAWMILPASAYYAGLLVVSLTAWLPIFLTGRAADMPADLAWGALPLYGWLAKKLERRGGVQVEYWGRRPLLAGARSEASPPDDAQGRAATSPTYDEIRLRLLPERPLAGLRALEVGVELGAGVLALPCVVVRVEDDSAAYRALPRHVHWVRGRQGEERVSLLRPRVPSRQQCFELVLALLAALTGPTKRPARRPGRSVAASAPAPMPTV